LSARFGTEVGLDIISAGVYRLASADQKIKVGEIEVEATQMSESQVLKIFDLLQEKADRKQIRELLLNPKNQ
jgi:hypothetical protein